MRLTTNFALCAGTCWYVNVVTASGAANYSVQLMEGLAPKGWTDTQWASAVDVMIGKTSGVILSDLVEDLGIKLQVSEGHVRERIDKDRAALALPPMPPHEDQPGPMDFLTRHLPKKEPKEDYTAYLPPGWTEETYDRHTEKDLEGLPVDVREKIDQRLAQEQRAEHKNPNKGSFEQLPEKIFKDISQHLHDVYRKAHGLDPEVRSWKREIAPIVQLVETQGLDEWGLLMCRTTTTDQAKWEKFEKVIDGIMDAQVEGEWRGKNMDMVAQKLSMPMTDDKDLEGADARSCAKYFLELVAASLVPMGHDMPMILMADEASVDSLINPSTDTPPHLWAVDVYYDPEKQSEYPAGYEGKFKVHSAAIVHDLYVPLASGYMNPVEIWQLTQPKTRTGAKKASHDEL